MRVVIIGQRWLGAEVLQLVRRRGHEVAAVVAPWRPGGTDRLEAAASVAGIPVHHRCQPQAVPEGTDLVIAAHAHSFIGAPLRERARLGAIGYHPSLLPVHRGRDAIRWAIRLREPVTGGSVYWLEERADAGPIAAQDWCFIAPGDTAETLWRRELAPMGLRLLDRVVADASAGRINKTPQDEALATWEPAFSRPALSAVG